MKGDGEEGESNIPFHKKMPCKKIQETDAMMIEGVNDSQTRHVAVAGEHELDPVSYCPVHTRPLSMIMTSNSAKHCQLQVFYHSSTSRDRREGIVIS